MAHQDTCNQRIIGVFLCVKTDAKNKEEKWKARIGLVSGFCRELTRYINCAIVKINKTSMLVQ